jgi:uncharacterized protein YecT (DUF1311 family)
MAEYASNAKGNAGLTTGIIGTSLAGLLALGAGNNGNGGFLSGLFGGNNNNCQMQLAAAQSEIARLGSELYANQVGTEVYSAAVQMSKADDAKINANYKELAQAIASLDKQVGIIQATQPLYFQLANCASEKYTDNATKYLVPGKVVLPTSAMCVENMNSWLQNSEYTPIPKVTTSTTPSA